MAKTQKNSSGPRDTLAVIADHLGRIATALEAAYPPRPSPDFSEAGAFTWEAASGLFIPSMMTGALPLALLVGLEDHAETLLQNTRQFAEGHPANNALLWGARGMGKSALVKSVHAALAKKHPLKLIEIHREDLGSLSTLRAICAGHPSFQFLLFCDDLSFDAEDTGYKSLKPLLDGGVGARPANMLFYATSNRRHLMPRTMMENEQRSAVHGGEVLDEKISLSDRFGLWLGFYPCEQDQYLEMVRRYADKIKLDIRPEELQRAALQWASARGARSGRVAWQFITDLAGRQAKKLASFNGDK